MPKVIKVRDTKHDQLLIPDIVIVQRVDARGIVHSTTEGGSLLAYLSLTGGVIDAEPLSAVILLPEDEFASVKAVLLK